MRYIFLGVAILSLISIGFYLNNGDGSKPLSQQIEYGGVLWPKNIKYEVDKVGDIKITLLDEFSALEGEWPAGTQFKFDGNNLSFIQVPSKFTFGQLSFDYPTKIHLEDFPPHTLHYLEVKKDSVVDGLDLKVGCKIQFKDYVLYAANCEEFGTVYFKRSVELPENSASAE